MRYILSIFTLSLGLLNAHLSPIEHREDFREVHHLIESHQYERALEKLTHVIHHHPDLLIKMSLLLERAYVHLSLQHPFEALADLDCVIFMDVPDFEKENDVVRAAWMHFAISAALRDSSAVRRDIDLIKRWDKNFPQIDFHHDTAHIKINTLVSQHFFLFDSLLESFRHRNLSADLTYHTHSVHLKISTTAPHYLIESAAACAFTSSPWGEAAADRINHTFGVGPIPHFDAWKYPASAHYKVLLERIAR